jgi:hypothetical protein
MDAPAFFTAQGSSGRGGLAGFCNRVFTSGGFVVWVSEIELGWFKFWD